MALAPLDFFAAEGAIVQQVRDQVPGLRAVLSAAEIAEVEESRQTVPAVHVVYFGGQPQPQGDGYFVNLQEEWRIGIAVRNVRDRKGKAARGDVGPFVVGVVRALHHFRPTPDYGLLSLQRVAQPVFQNGFLYVVLQYAVKHDIPVVEVEGGITPDTLYSHAELLTHV